MSLAELLPRRGDARQELWVVLQPVLEPVLLTRKADQHSGRPAVARDHDLLLGGGAEISREIILDLSQRNPGPVRHVRRATRQPGLSR